MTALREAAEAAQEPVVCPYCSSHTIAVYFDQNCAGCVKRMTTQFQHQPLSNETTLDVSGATCLSPAPAKWPERGVPEALTIDAKDQSVGLFVKPPNAKLKVSEMQEPVAWLFTHVQSGDYDFCYQEDAHRDDREMWHKQPLYTAKHQRKPLTPEEIDLIDKSISATASLEDGKRMFARAIEAAHGIGSKT